MAHVLGRRRGGVGMDRAGLKRVLVLRPDGIGDAVMNTPFLRELRRALPHAWIALAVQPAVRNLVELCPYVDEVLTYDGTVAGGMGRLRKLGRVLGFARKELWRRRFDTVILPRWDADDSHATFAAYFSGARRRLGYSEHVSPAKAKRNRHYDALLTHAVCDGGVRHEVERNLHVVRFLGAGAEGDAPELWLSEDDEAHAEAALAGAGIRPGEPVAALCPSRGASPLKAWPVERFIEIGRWLCEEVGARVLLVGDSGDRAVGVEVEKEVGRGVVNLAGRTTLRQCAALIGRASLYLGCDVGVTHMAAAMGTPVVALFGASCPHRFAPRGRNCTVLWSDPDCGPCRVSGHSDSCRECTLPRPQCMEAISVEQVKEALAGRIQERRELRCSGAEGEAKGESLRAAPALEHCRDGRCA